MSINPAYEFLFGTLKGHENSEPAGTAMFNFTAHGKDQNLKFKLYFGRNEIGELRYLPLASTDEPAADDTTKYTLIVGAVVPRIIEKYKGFGKYKDGDLRLVEALFKGFSDNVIQHRLEVMPTRLIMQGILVDQDDLAPMGRVHLDIKVRTKTDFELRAEALHTHVKAMRERQEKGLPVYRLGEPDPLADQAANACIEEPLPGADSAAELLPVESGRADCSQEHAPTAVVLESPHDSLTSKVRLSSAHGDRGQAVEVTEDPVQL